jgi:site-specific recombinase XerD
MKIVKSIEDLIIFFIADRRMRNLSKLSILSYKSKLKAFTDSTFCPKNIDDINRGDLRVFFDMYSKNHSPSTVFAVFNVLNIFFAWYENELDGKWDNPIKRIDAPRVPPKILDPIKIEDVQKMLSYCNITYRALLMFLLDSGLRSRELLDLNVDDVDLFSGQVFVKSGKGNKSRYVYIGAKTRKVVRKYLQTRKYQNSEALWVANGGNRLSYSGLNAAIKRICIKAGIKPQSAHSFRRAFTLSMIRSRQVDLITLSVMLGHSSTATLTRYAKIANVDTMEAHRRAGPVDNML